MDIDALLKEKTIDEYDVLEVVQDVLLHALSEAIAVPCPTDEDFNASLSNHLWRSFHFAGSGDEEVNRVARELIWNHLKR